MLRANNRDTGKTQEHRKAYAVVASHLKRLSSSLDETDELGSVAFLGLWYAAINVVLSLLEPDVALRLLEDRGRGIHGFGSNADAELIQISAEDQDDHQKRVVAAAEVVIDLLDQAYDELERMELSEFFPDTVLDAAIQVLLACWGPFHVRRCLSEQWMSLTAGSHEVLVPKVPKDLNHAPEPAQQAPAPLPSPAETRIEPPRSRRTEARFVEVFTDADCDPSTGQGAWAAIVISHEKGGRREMREISSPITDNSGRVASLLAVLESFKAIGSDGNEATVRFATTSEFIFDFFNVHEADRIPPDSSRERSLWQEIDQWSKTFNTEWVLARRNMSNEMSERCDRLIRRILIES